MSSGTAPIRRVDAGLTTGPKTHASHSGEVICDSTVICEYLGDVFKDIRLRPADALEHARVLYWTKAVDEVLHPACGFVTFLASHRHIVLRLGPEKVEEFLQSTPKMSVTADWHETKKSIVRNGFDAAGAPAKIMLYDHYLQKMEETLADNEWLAGENFTFADIAMTPYVNRLDMLSMSGMWTGGRLPAVESWFDRIKARASFRPALLDWLPDDLAHDLRTFGAQSWPEIARIAGIGNTAAAETR
jgi:ganglioside-induced differentiation-associated protein 1